MSEPSASAVLDALIARMAGMPDEERAALVALAQQETQGMLWLPNPGPQTDAYFSPADLTGYGGQAGGGKSELLCGTALNDHFASRLFRRHFKDIDGLGGLAPALKRILGTWEGYSKQTHVWTIPQTPRAIEFGAFTNEQEAEAYRGRPADFLGFDEAQQFIEMLIRFLMAWNRTTIPGQRCRTILTFNPPTTPEELFIFEMFAAWLDDRHPNPAKPGELRYYTTIKGHDVEVPADWRGETKDGLVILPKSRTFIRARLIDNPDLAETNYASQLAQLPPHLRDALMDGKFSAQLDDDAWQIIPTEWVLAAQQRWVQRQAEFEAGTDKGPMHALGADIAMGGEDAMALAPRYGTFFDEVQVKAGVDVKNPRTAAAFIFSVVRDDAQVNMDCTGGWGSGVIEHLESNRHPCVRVVFSNKSMAKARDGSLFYNKRTEILWRLREALDPITGDDVAIQPGRRILSQLTATRWMRVSLEGKPCIKAEPKDEVIKRIGYSPDEGEAIALANAERDTLWSPLRNGGFHKRGGPEVNRANQEAKNRSARWRGKRPDRRG